MAAIEAIQTWYLADDAATVLFDDIPSTYKHLQMRISSRDSNNGTVESLYMQFGDSGHSPVDTGTNYSRHYMIGAGGSASASSGTGSNDIWLGKHAARYPASAYFGALIVDIFDYANANKKTTVMVLDNGLPDKVEMRSGLWHDTSVVNAIKMLANGNFKRGSEFSLYGIQE